MVGDRGLPCHSRTAYFTSSRVLARLGLLSSRLDSYLFKAQKGARELCYVWSFSILDFRPRLLL